ncbi:hypothetical protein KR018_003074, partial [Drosophila ironensis]
MPRGKYVNHKGRLRQFTPADELQKQMEEKTVFMGMMSIPPEKNDTAAAAAAAAVAKQSDTEDSDEPSQSSSPREPCLGIRGLIEISNPNRLPREKPINWDLTMKEYEKKAEDEAAINRRRERKRERLLNQNMQKSHEAKADLARLALVRKEREEAAQRRLAAKPPPAAATNSTPAAE